MGICNLYNLTRFEWVSRETRNLLDNINNDSQKIGHNCHNLGIVPFSDTPNILHYWILFYIFNWLVVSTYPSEKYDQYIEKMYKNLPNQPSVLGMYIWNFNQDRNATSHRETSALTRSIGPAQVEPRPALLTWGHHWENVSFGQFLVGKTWQNYRKILGNGWEMVNLVKVASIFQYCESNNFGRWMKIGHAQALWDWMECENP